MSPLTSFATFIAVGILVAVMVDSAQSQEGEGQWARTVESFSGYDFDGDGTVEIESITVLTEARDPSEASEGLVLILVEERLLAPLPKAPSIRPSVDRYASDLEKEGLRSIVATVRLYEGERHQDGRVLLALRELLKKISQECGSLRGTTLIGRFPDAFIVRSCNWRKANRVILHAKTEREKVFESTPYLRTVPEDVAHRGDIVLADLDGHWHEHYFEGPETLPLSYVIFPDGVPSEQGSSDTFERRTVVKEDFFYVDDGRLTLTSSKDDPDVLDVVLLPQESDRECTTADRQRGNPLAQPEIAVSRIDARGVAWKPMDGLLDEDGRPRTKALVQGEAPPRWHDVWVADPVLERELLVAFFERNHRYRTSPSRERYRPASIACDLASGLAVVQSASEDWETFDRKIYDRKGRPTLVDFVEWMALPAVLRTLRAHSDPYGSVFAKGDVAALEKAAGGEPWCWEVEGSTLKPSLAPAASGGRLDFFLLRTMWENGVLENDKLDGEGAFYLHTGCHGISPPGAPKLRFSDPHYGQRQGAESLLFYGQGLALVGRSKVFYDEPREFCLQLREGERFGDAWRHYFEVESKAKSFGEVGGDIGRKRSYFWSVLGDWTLRLGTPSS